MTSIYRSVPPIRRGTAHHGVVGGGEGPRIGVQREVQVDGPFAPLCGVQVDLPGLAQRVALDEVPLVVDMKAVLDGMVLEIGDEPGDVDDGHRYRPSVSWTTRTPWASVRNARARCESACFS